MQVIRNYNGIPQPAPQDGPPLHIQIGDTIELITGDAHSLFWQVLYGLANSHSFQITNVLIFCFCNFLFFLNKENLICFNQNKYLIQLFLLL